jgi:hypothetical protein
VIALLYLPVLATLHFGAGAALGGMAVLSAKAISDLAKRPKV